MTHTEPPVDKINNNSLMDKNKSEDKDDVEDKNDVEEIDKKVNTSYPLITSILTNLVFYIITFLCLIFISYYSDSGIISTIITFILTSFLGYFSHYNSHHIKFVDFYTKLDNYITRNSLLNCICLNVCYFLDFHEITHHNSDINKTPINLFYEFINNFVTQGGLLMILIYIARCMNLYVCLLWGLLYSTVHIINYSLYPSLSHNYHHYNKYTNYGIDIWDILLGTKNENTPVENMNHYGINLIILTPLIIKLFCI